MAVNAARLVEEITARLSLRFGPGIAAWCAAVPALAQEMAARWDVKLEQAVAELLAQAQWARVQ